MKIICGKIIKHQLADFLDIFNCPLRQIVFAGAGIAYALYNISPVFLLIVGMVMDTTPAILILSPILLPIVQSIGMNPIHFGVVMIVNLAIGFVTPPIGVNLFVASSLTDVPVMRIAKKAAPMIGYFLLALLLLTFIPAISLCLL